MLDTGRKTGVSPSRNKLRPRMDTSVLIPNCAATNELAEENILDAYEVGEPRGPALMRALMLALMQTSRTEALTKVAHMVVLPYINVTRIFFPRDQFMGLAGSSGPSKVTFIGGQRGLAWPTAIWLGDGASHTHEVIFVLAARLLSDGWLGWIWDVRTPFHISLPRTLRLLLRLVRHGPRSRRFHAACRRARSVAATWQVGIVLDC